MREHFRKLNRIRPLIRIKKMHVDKETENLLKIRSEKQKIIEMLRKTQEKYVRGVEDLNKVRCSNDRINLETLEHAIDTAKNDWYFYFKKAQDIEKIEKDQVNKLINVEKNLKSIEKIKEKSTSLLQKELNKLEQKELDEFTIRKQGSRNQSTGS